MVVIRSKIIRKFSIFYFARYVEFAVTGIMLIWLGTKNQDEDMALMTRLLFCVQVSSFGHLGFNSLLPKLYIKDAKHKQELTNIYYNFFVLQSIIVSIFCTIYLLNYEYHYILVFLLIIFFHNARNFDILVLRSLEEINTSSILILIFAALFLILFFAFEALGYQSIDAYIYAWMTAVVGSGWFGLRQYFFTNKEVFARIKFKNLIGFIELHYKSALTMLAISFLAFVLLAADKFFLLHFIKQNALTGQYQKIENLSSVFHRGIAVIQFLFVPTVIAIGSKKNGHWRNLFKTTLYFNLFVASMGAVYLALVAIIDYQFWPDVVQDYKLLCFSVGYKVSALVHFVPTYILIGKGRLDLLVYAYAASLVPLTYYYYLVHVVDLNLFQVIVPPLIGNIVCFIILSGMCLMKNLNH
jgi:hypothetical protein